jgi:P-type Cu2+ transporter
MNKDHSMHQAAKPGQKHSHHKGMLDDFRRRFWISLIIMIPVLILSPMIQHWLGIEISFPGDKYILAVLSSIIFFYGGYPFLSGLISEVKKLRPGMMTLIGFAITVAYVYSTAIVFGLPGMDFYWELATLIVIMLAGHWIEMKSEMSATNALEKLIELLPDEAHLITDSGTENVKVKELKKNDLILIKPGEKIPADGVIIEGKSYVDESILTGESKPVEKVKDNGVIAGSVNGNGSLKVKVKASEEDSYLSKVIKLVEDAQSKKSSMQHLADKAAFILTMVALFAGTATLIIWLSMGESFNFSLERMVTVMVISCPHALGLAIPLVVAISTAYSARTGLLIRNRTAFENSRKITTVVFDKTGTLTKGKFGVSKYDSFDEKIDKDELLKLAASLEQESEHPIATGILNEAKEKDLKLYKLTEFENMTGEGIKGKVDGKDIKIVSPAYAGRKKLSLPDDVSKNEGTTVIVLIDDKPAGFFTLADEIRETSKEAIKELHKMKIKSIMLTGDNKEVAKEISDKLNMDGYFAEVLPDQKLEKVKELQEEGEFVAMTGDGVNDAPALAQADVGIAIGSGTDVAAETADIILVDSDPLDVVKVIDFGRETYKKMIQNLIYATGYNVIAIPLGAGVLYGYGIMIDPAIGAVLMSLSTVAVAINAQFLRKKLK